MYKIRRHLSGSLTFAVTILVATAYTPVCLPTYDYVKELKKARRP